MRSILLLLCTILLGNTLQAQKGYELTIKVKGMENKEVYLGFHLGSQQFVKDTVMADSKGIAVFKGKENLEGGMYLYITNDKKFFEFLVDNSDQKFTIETDTLDFVGHWYTKNPLNREFNDYQKYIYKLNRQADPYTKRLKYFYDEKLEEVKADSIKILRNELDILDRQVKAYKNEIIRREPGGLLAGIFKLSKEVDIPEAPILPNGRKDSIFSYRYNRAHYFDEWNFNDNRLVKTPVMQPRLFYYFDKILPQIADSIVPEVDKVMSKVSDPFVFKFMVQSLTNHYEKSKIMGLDQVKLHLYKNYYLSDRCDWADAKMKFKIDSIYQIEKNLLLGLKAPNLILKDTLGQYINVEKLPSKYVLLVFWNPDCGHCKKELPKLVDMYAKLKAQGIEVVTATPEVDEKKWKKGIKDLKLPFINVADIEKHNYFRTIWGLTTTPQLYFLDENRVIRGKKLDVDNLDKFLKNIMHIEL